MPVTALAVLQVPPVGVVLGRDQLTQPAFFRAHLANNIIGLMLRQSPALEALRARLARGYS